MATKKFVVYLDGDGGYVETHGGPYTPFKAWELRQSMEKHVNQGTGDSWSIPDEAEVVETMTADELRELKREATAGD